MVLLCVDQDKGWVRRRSVIGYALLAAAFCDLAISGQFSLESGRIEAEDSSRDDAVLADLMASLIKMQGKRYSWSLSGFTMRVNRRYRLQMQHLEREHLISSRPVEWLGISWGKRYRVNRIDRLKPLITQFERVLIYGKEPSLETRLLIEILGTMDLLGVIFCDKELHSRAKKRFYEIYSREYSQHHTTLMAIRKEFRKALRNSNILLTK